MQHAVALEHDHLVLGRYRPLRPLGSGGSGSVWLVRDERSGRDVALKVVPREGKAGSRAEREVEAATRLRHPRCLQALALERDDEHVYVAYEYIRGKTLRQALRSGELDDASAIETAAQVLEALGHAHRKGIVHRDVKPSNVMLEEGEGVSARVLDFGLAQLEEADTLTAAGDVPGTLAYISPERLEGREATGAADVWAVGVLLWEALAGWHPFAAGSPLETGRRIAAGAPPLAKARPDLPRPFCALVDRMLQLDPGRRPTAKHLPDELREGANARLRRRRATTSLHALEERAPHAALAGVTAAAATILVPFFPSGWPFLLGALATLASLLSPRTGLVIALAAPILPLGNISLGLAVLYGALAVVWLGLFAHDPRAGLIWIAGPILAPVGGLPLAALLAARAAGPVRRAAVAGASVLAGAGLAGLVGRGLPFTGELPPPGIGLSGSDDPLAVAGALLGFVGDRPWLAACAVTLALAAAAVPHAMARGAWGAAVWGAGLLAALVLAPHAAGAGGVDVFPTALAVWVAAGLLVIQAAEARR